jgi:ParB family chromosome partitioning protein
MSTNRFKEMQEQRHKNSAALNETYKTGTEEKVLEGEVIVNVDCRDIDPSPYQQRTEFPPEVIEALKKLIEANGQAQPVGLRSIGGGRYQLIWGECRWRACMLLPDKTVKAVIRDVSDVEMIFIGDAENTGQSKPADFARWVTISYAIAEKVEKDEILKKMNLSASDYYKYLSYGDLPLAAQELVRKHPNLMGRNTASEVAGIYKSIEGEDSQKEFSAELIELLGKYKAGKITRQSDIPKALKERFVVKRQRTRPKVNKEETLKVGQTTIGSRVNTPNELRLTFSKNELAQDDIEEINSFIDKLIAQRTAEA